MGAPKGNKYALGNEGGRPPIHTDPEQVGTLVRDYFEWIKGEEGERDKDVMTDDGVTTIKERYWIRKPEPPTVTGLTLHLGFCDKSTLYDYSRKEEFSHHIKRGLAQIEKYHEIKASHGDKCVGNIFVLKNFGWSDKIETTNEHKGEIKIVREIKR